MRLNEGKNGGSMNIMIKWLVAVLTIIACAATAGADIVDRIVAVVNADIVTLSDLNTAFEPYMARINEQYKDRDKTKIIAEGKTAILNRLIDNKLIEQQAKRSGLSVKDDELMIAIKDILKQRKVEMSEFIKMLVREGTTFDAYKQDVREQMLRQRLVRREIQSKILVTDEEIGEYYKEHRQDYEGKEAVRIKQILLIVPRDSEQSARDEIRKQADAIRKRLMAGESFDQMAAKYSEGPAAQSGGDIGFIERGHAMRDVETVAFQLGIDEVSEVIESPLGFHIIKMVEKKGAGMKPWPEVRQDIFTKIEDQKMAQRFEQWIAEIRKKSIIEIKL
jgi:peptidyl-prolyl cis-trans isomerase SurA